MRYIHELPGEAAVTSPLPLTGSPLGKQTYKVHILALGDVGMTMLIGLRLLGAGVVESIGICDINESNIRRLEMEINQIRYPFADWEGSGMPSLPPVYAVGEEDLFDCDVFVFCASKGVPPVGAQGDVRMAQLAANTELVRHFAELAKAAEFAGLTCIVSDPVDPLCKAFWLASGLKPAQVQGYGLGVMNARACYYAERRQEFRAYLTEGRAFGPHGGDLVLADSLTDYDDERSRALTDLVIGANMAVRELGYKPYIAPALSSAALSILLTLREQWHYGSVYLGDEGAGAFFGIRNQMTRDGIIYEDAAVCDALYERLKTAYINLCRLV